jgi:WhiB family redox-sensing transcriptional regulator
MTVSDHHLIKTLRPAPWMRQAACRNSDPELFFPTRGATDTVAAAQAICADCPVWVECLEYGLFERQGIWGGLTDRQRRRLRKIRRLREGGA